MTLLRILLLSAVLVGLGSAVPSERKGPNDSTTDSDISQYLTAHNRVRAQHGANPLSWDEELASKAREWANRCVFEHSGGKLGRYGGE